MSVECLRDAPHWVLDRVALQRGSTCVFDSLSLTLSESRIGLIGRNGAGKSSLLRLLCGLEAPHSGQVCVEGHRVTSDAFAAMRTQWVGMMFQSPDEQIIFPTVEEELALGLQGRARSRKQALEWARDALTERGLQAWARRAVGTLSQGQRQYLCWLSLQVMAPRVLLLDEPYSSLDGVGQRALAQELEGCTQQVIVSTHQLEWVRGFDRVLWMEQGQLQADGKGSEVCAAYEDWMARQVLSYGFGALGQRGGHG